MFDYFGGYFGYFDLNFQFGFLFYFFIWVFFLSVLVLFLVSSLGVNSGSYLLVYRYGVITNISTEYVH